LAILFEEFYALSPESFQAAAFSSARTSSQRIFASSKLMHAFPGWPRSFRRQTQIPFSVIKMLHCRKTVKFPRANRKGVHRWTPLQFRLKNFTRFRRLETAQNGGS